MAKAVDVKNMLKSHLIKTLMFSFLYKCHFICLFFYKTKPNNKYVFNNVYLLLLPYLFFYKYIYPPVSITSNHNLFTPVKKCRNFIYTWMIEFVCTPSLACIM